MVWDEFGYGKIERFFMTTPLISVIVPVYNNKELLPKCIDSIIQQTYTNLEIILVDDGSNDGTGKLCDELAGRDTRIKVYHKENGGSSSARNLGIQNAKGDYLGFVDSDDFIEPDMYEKLMIVIIDKKCKIVQIGRNEIDEAGNLLPDICNPPQKLSFCSSEEFMKELLLHKGDCSFCTKLIEKSLFLERQFPIGVLNEDFYLLIHMLTQENGIYSLPGYGYHVFYRIGSNTRRADKEDFPRVYGDCVKNADVAAELVREYFPSLKGVALRFGLFQRLEYLLHIPFSQMNATNKMYKQCVLFIKRNCFGMLLSRDLTTKNKVYLTALGWMPKFTKRLHSIKMNTIKEHKYPKSLH